MFSSADPRIFSSMTLRRTYSFHWKSFSPLVFIPCPVWIKGDEQLINLNPSSPRYQLGSVKKLLDKENLKFSLKSYLKVRCNIIKTGTFYFQDFIFVCKEVTLESYLKLDSIVHVDICSLLFSIIFANLITITDNKVHSC